MEPRSAGQILCRGYVVSVQNRAPKPSRICRPHAIPKCSRRAKYSPVCRYGRPAHPKPRVISGCPPRIMTCMVPHRPIASGRAAEYTARPPPGLPYNKRPAPMQNAASVFTLPRTIPAPAYGRQAVGPCRKPVRNHAKRPSERIGFLEYGLKLWLSTRLCGYAFTSPRSKP